MLLYLSTLSWLCDATPHPAQWKTVSESDMCADCEPDPGECCEISVWDKTQNRSFTITEGQAGHALLAEWKKKKKEYLNLKGTSLSFCLSPPWLIWLNEICQQLFLRKNKAHKGLYVTCLLNDFNVFFIYLFAPLKLLKHIPPRRPWDAIAVNIL